MRPYRLQPPERIIQPPEVMGGASTAGSRLFKKQMKLQLRLKPISKLLVLLLSFYILAPLPALASTYGSCSYGEGCSQSTSSISGVPNKSFFNEYEWIIFASLIFIILLLLFLLLAYRRKNSKDEDNHPPTPPTRTQP